MFVLQNIDPLITQMAADILTTKFTKYTKVKTFRRGQGWGHLSTDERRLAQIEKRDHELVGSIEGEREES